MKIPNNSFVFRRVPLKLFLNTNPPHRLKIVKAILMNENGDGMSVDWEEICKAPSITQTRGGKDPVKYGVVVLSYSDITAEAGEQILYIINDKIEYDCHCLVKGYPMSPDVLKEKKTELYDRIKDNVRRKIRSAYVEKREILLHCTFWIISLHDKDLKNPPKGFNQNLTPTMKDFFKSRNHKIPS